MHLPTPPMSMITPGALGTIPRRRLAGSSLSHAKPSATSVRDNHQVTVEFVELLNNERERKIKANAKTTFPYSTILNKRRESAQQSIFLLTESFNISTTQQWYAHHSVSNLLSLLSKMECSIEQSKKRMRHGSQSITAKVAIAYQGITTLVR